MTKKHGNEKITQVGQRWRVAWRDSTVHLAEIVEIRKAPEDVADVAGGPRQTSRSGSGESPENGTVVAAGGSQSWSPLAGGGWEGASLYVHYVDFDRRLDEWVGLERVDLVAGQQRSVAAQNGDKRRVTTRMKSECDRPIMTSCVYYL